MAASAQAAETSADIEQPAAEVQDRGDPEAGEDDETGYETDRPCCPVETIQSAADEDASIELR